jgi:hypothetical protein
VVDKSNGKIVARSKTKHGALAHARIRSGQHQG